MKGADVLVEAAHQLGAEPRLRIVAHDLDDAVQSDGRSLDGHLPRGGTRLRARGSGRPARRHRRARPALGHARVVLARHPRGAAAGRAGGRHRHDRSRGGGRRRPERPRRAGRRPRAAGRRAALAHRPVDARDPATGRGHTTRGAVGRRAGGGARRALRAPRCPSLGPRRPPTGAQRGSCSSWASTERRCATGRTCPPRPWPCTAWHSDIRHYRDPDVAHLAARADVVVAYRVPATPQVLVAHRRVAERGHARAVRRGRPDLRPCDRRRDPRPAPAPAR